MTVPTSEIIDFAKRLNTVYETVDFIPKTKPKPKPIPTVDFVPEVKSQPVISSDELNKLIDAMNFRKRF